MPSCVRLDLWEVPKKFGNLKSGLPRAGSSANTSKAAKASGLFKRKACKSDSLTMPPLAVLIIEIDHFNRLNSFLLIISFVSGKNGT